MQGKGGGRCTAKEKDDLFLSRLRWGGIGFGEFGKLMANYCNKRFLQKRFLCEMTPPPFSNWKGSAVVEEGVSLRKGVR